MFIFSFQNQLADFDNLTQQLANQAENDLKPLLEAEANHARLVLKEKQHKEMLAALMKYTPDDKELIEEYRQKSANAEKDAKKYQDEDLKRALETYQKEEERLKKMLADRQKKLAEALRYMLMKPTS